MKNYSDIGKKDEVKVKAKVEPKANKVNARQLKREETKKKIEKVLNKAAYTDKEISDSVDETATECAYLLQQMQNDGIVRSFPVKTGGLMGSKHWGLVSKLPEGF